MAGIDFGKSDFQFAQLDEEFEPRIASVFNQTTGHNISIKPKLNLREVILLDSQSMIDIFRNQALVEKTTSLTEEQQRHDGSVPPGNGEWLT